MSTREIRAMYARRRFDEPASNIPESQLPDYLEQDMEGVKRFQGASREAYTARLELEHNSEAAEVFKKVCAIAKDVAEAGGRALLVGGAVRDEVVGILSKDFDVEVYGLQPENILEIVQRYGNVEEVGAAFGILTVTDPSGFNIDVSLPRVDSKQVGKRVLKPFDPKDLPVDSRQFNLDLGAAGEKKKTNAHKAFDVHTDPFMSIKEAAKRRDFSFNALSKDPLTGEIFDPFNGVEDLRTRTLRVTDEERFRDDPLRILRASQFVARLGLQIEPRSMGLMRSMVKELHGISAERFKAEWEKMLLKPEKPSMGLQAMFDIGIIHELYPELAGLKETDQEFEWHPEGDVWVHTLMVVDAAAQVVRREQLDPDTARITMLGALTHDLGKPMTTTFEEGRLRSRGHEPAGEEPTRTFLEKVGILKKDIEKVVGVVKEHLWPSIQYIRHTRGEKVSDGSIRRLAKRLHPATIEELTYVSEADHHGRGPFLDPAHSHQFLLPDPYVAGAWLRREARELGVSIEQPKPPIMGRDLLSVGFVPGRNVGAVMTLCERLRDELDWDKAKMLEVIHAQIRANPRYKIHDERTGAENQEDMPVAHFDEDAVIAHLKAKLPEIEDPST